jgi:hypothetical protein
MDSLKGWIIMGDHLGIAGNFVEVFEAYETAAKISPQERDHF